MLPQKEIFTLCNQHTLDHETAARREQLLSRRDFSLLAFSTAAVAMLPARAAPLAIKESTVAIKTADGMADAFFAHPADGKHPGVLMWPDFMGLRPAYQQLASKLAEAGYAVLAVNPYYRSAKAPILEKADFENKAAMEKFSAYARAISRATLATDSQAFVGFLDGQPVTDRKQKLATLGYCMSGSWTFSVAAQFPERVGAIASFHGGGLAAEGPLKLIDKMRAQALIAISQDDDEREPQAKTLLRDAFARAKLTSEVEVYQADHGWCTPDMVGLFNAAQAQRAWARLLALLERAL